jgi:hypothetical protein
MFGTGKHQPKPTEKAKDFFQSMKKAVKRKQSNEITTVSTSKAKRTLIAVPSDSEENANQSTSTSRTGPTGGKRAQRAMVQSEDDEDSLHGGAEVIEIPAPKPGHNGNESESELESPEEDSEGEMSMCLMMLCYRSFISITGRLSKDWISPIYAFFEPFPVIGHDNGRRYHEFKCVAKGCGKRIRRFLDTKDAKSTSNMRKHARNCWGEEVVKSADEARNCDTARDSIVKAILTNGSITASFERRGKGKVTFSHRQHTKTETK